MQYDDIEVCTRESNGEHVVEISGYHRVQPESKPGECRRVAIVDFSEAQARTLHDRLGGLLAD